MNTMYNYLPDEFTNRIQTQFPESHINFLSSLENEPAVSIRVNSRKFNGNLSQLEKVKWCDSGYYLGKRPSFTLDPLFHAGAYYVQESSSMFLEQVFKMIPKEKPLLTLDLCGAPGGKSTHLLSLLSDDDLLVSNEVIRSRSFILQENLQKWGHQNIIVTNNDPKDFSALNGLFDLIVVDAPCSGEGLFRRDHAAVEQWSVENTKLCSTRQRRILSDIWPSLKTEGYLIYSTCTFNPSENEENLRWLSENKQIESIRIPISSDWYIHEINHNGLTAYQFLPHQSKGEGFFITVLKKTGKEPDFNMPKKNDSMFEKLPKRLDHIKGQISNPYARLFVQKDLIISFPDKWFSLASILNKRLKVINTGLAVVRMKNNDQIPEHAFALSLDRNTESFQTIELDIENAIRFLKKEEIKSENKEKGWFIASYKQSSLGFLKGLGNRMNNYYPKEWRIRMNISKTSKPWHEE